MEASADKTLENAWNKYFVPFWKLFNCRLNLKTLIWEPYYTYMGRGLDYEPEGRYRHEVACDTENIYILGGGTSLEVYDLIDLPTFNIKTRTWLKKHTMAYQGL